MRSPPYIQLICSDMELNSSFCSYIFIVRILISILYYFILFFYFPVTSNKLNDERDEHDLVSQLVTISSDWRVIGSALCVGENFLKGLDGSPDPLTVKLCKVINKWITSGDQSLITWEKVISAIEGPVVDNKKKADEIREYLGLTKQS